MSYIGNLNTHRGLIGKIGEDIACDFLISKGHVIVERNMRIKYGEIDIISMYKNTLHFIEVKTTMSTNVTAEEHLDRRKMRKMANLAELYYKSYVNIEEKEEKRIGEYNMDSRETEMSLDFIGVYLNNNKTLKNVVYLESLEI